MEICDYFPPAQNSMGSERIIERLTQGLVAAGHEVGMKLSADATVCPVPGAHLVHDDLRNVDADILHFHGWDPLEYQKFNHSWATTVHGYQFHQLPNLAVGNPHVIAVSEFAQKRLGLIQHVHNFSDPNEFAFQKNKENYFLWLGGTDWGEAKGLFSAIMLCKRLRVRLIVAGTGRNQVIINEIKSLCDDRIRFIGPLNGQEKVSYIKNAKALILLSKVPDACPVTVSESLMCGTPVIASGEGSLPEIVVHGVTGYVCRTLAEEIKAIVNIDKISPKTCREYAIANFSTEVATKRYETIFKRILEAGRK